MIRRRTTFKQGELVSLKTAPGAVYLITGYVIKGNHLTYLITQGTEESCHQDYELERIKADKIKGFR